MEIEEDDFDLKIEMREGAIISDARGGGYNVNWSDRHLTRTSDFDKALKAVAEKMEKDHYFPNVFYVNDHGNVDLLAVKLKIIKGKVVKATSKTIRSWV